MENNSSSPLHTTEVSITFKDYKIHHSKGQSKIISIINLSCYPALFLIIIQYFIDNPSFNLAHVMLLLPVMLVILVSILSNFELKREFNSNRLLNSRFTLQFYCDSLEILKFKNEDVISRGCISYTEFHNIVKNKEHFYLTTPELMVTILPRRFCNPELIKFLENLSEEIKNSKSSKSHSGL